MSVTATLLINFDPGSGGSAAENGHLSAEVDSRPEGLNAGKTTFFPGDDVYFFVYASSNVTYETPIPSAGSITALESETVSRTDDISFPNVDTATISVPATGITSYKWLGNQLGALTLQDEMTVKADAIGVAVAKIEYTTVPDVYKLSSPSILNGETEFTILIYIQGEVTGT